MGFNSVFKGLKPYVSDEKAPIKAQNVLFTIRDNAVLVKG
jgi:hypothetical protein